MYTSTSALFDPQYSRYSWSVAVASAGLLMYSTVLLVFLAHSSASALVQRPLSPTRSESPANRTVSPETKWRGVNRKTRKRTPRSRTAFRPKELFRRIIWGNPFMAAINHWRWFFVSAFSASLLPGSSPMQRSSHGGRGVHGVIEGGYRADLIVENNVELKSVE